MMVPEEALVQPPGPPLLLGEGDPLLEGGTKLQVGFAQASWIAVRM